MKLFPDEFEDKVDEFLTKTVIFMILSITILGLVAVVMNL